MLPGEDVDLAIWRRDETDGSDRTVTVTVTLTRLPTLRARGELPEDQSEERIIELGIAEMSTSTPELARRYGAPYRPGVMIERLVPGSRLEARVLPGSTIVTVVDEPIEDVRQFLDVLRRDHDLRRPVRVGLVKPDGEYDVAFLRVED
jgi:S1-C subfamily serine protease